MEPNLLGLVLDTSYVITAERARVSVRDFLQRIRGKFGEIEISLSPVTVSELVHGIYRGRNEQEKTRRMHFVRELVDIVPIHPIDGRTAWMAGQIEGEQAARGNVIPFEDLLIACTALEQGYAIITANLKHFEKVPGLRVISSPLDL